MRDQNDELLRRYLLGELAEEEENLLEARLLQDDELFEGMEAMEADLLDEYAHGRLSPEERARIERRLASSPQGRLRLAVIRGLAEIAPEETNGRILPFRRLKQAVSHPGFQTAAAMAAMLVITVGLFFLRPVPAIQPSEKHATHHAWKQNPSAPPDWIDHSGQESRIPGTKRPPAPQPPAPLPLVFKLALTIMRSGEDQLPRLLLNADTERVDIHLPLSPGDENFPSYQVVLRNAANRELVRREDLMPNSAEDLVLPVEAKLLQPGRYLVEVYGDSRALAFPEFEVPQT